MRMPTAYHADCSKPVVVKRPALLLPRRAKSFHSKSAPNSPLQPRELSKASPEPRYTKAVHLLFEAKRLAKEIEEKKRNGELIKFRPRAVSSLRSKENDQWQITTRKCNACSNPLKAGLFSIHQDLSYCNVPCYSMLFSSLASRYEFPVTKCQASKPNGGSLSPEQEVKRSLMLSKLRTYNTYYSEKPCQICCIERNNELVLEGVIKVYWGLRSPVSFMESDVSYWRNFKPEPPSAWNNNFDMGFDENANKKPDVLRSVRRAKSQYARRQHQPVIISSDVERSEIRLKRTQSTALKRNGRHLDTVQFTPPHSSSTTLRITDKVKVPEVVTMLLRKFQICNKPEQYTLFTVYESGCVKRLQIDESPLAVRLRLGPCEDVAKVYIMESDGQSDVSHEVAQYAQFSTTVLEKFCEKFTEEEEREIAKIKSKYESFKSMLRLQLEEIHNNLKETEV